MMEPKQDSPVYANYEDMRNSGPTSSTAYMVNMGPGELAPEDPARTPGPTQQYRGFKTCKLCFLEELKKNSYTVLNPNYHII